jgi:predicted nucleic acid-binding protein
MVLVDTSVWIRFLAGREPFASGLDEILGRDEVVGHEMVFGELLIGDIGGGRRNLLEAYVQMHQSNMVAHREVVEFVRERRLFARGVGWIDVNILASALVGGFQMWTADPRFFTLADELRVAYSPAPS